MIRNVIVIKYLVIQLVICKIVILDFVHRLNSKLGNFIVSEAGFCFRLQVERGGRGQKAYLLGPLVEASLVL
jgi:hypothetical protein